MDDATCYGDHPNQAVKLENPEELVPILSIKQELLEVEDPPFPALKLESPTEISIIAVKEDVLDLLEFKEEPDILQDLVLPGDDTDQCNTDNKDMYLRDGSDEDLISCEEEAVGKNNASTDSGMEISLNVKPSSLTDCKIFSVHQYSRDTVKKRMCKDEKASTVESTELKMSLHETIRNKSILQLEICNTTEQTLKCNQNKFHSCETCHKCFRTPYRLKTHLRTHTGSKPYTCDTCDMCFSHLCNLKTHIRIHTGSKPYTCDTCHKCFTQLSHWKTHTRIHTGSKPFTCDTCHKSFTRLSSFKTHTSIHTGSKPYTCDTCHKCFNQLSYLKRHQRTHRE